MAKETVEPRSHWAASVARWFDSYAVKAEVETSVKKVDWLRVTPFIILHLVCVAVLWVGWSWVAVGVAAMGYAVRMFAITGFYHRYFSHRTYKTSRLAQFIFAMVGNSSVQRGPQRTELRPPHGLHAERTELRPPHRTRRCRPLLEGITNYNSAVNQTIYSELKTCGNHM